MSEAVEEKSGAEPSQTGGSLTLQAYRRLREDILSGVLLPASRLKIEALMARHATGATPIREALSLLTSDGLVERLDNRGFRVAAVSRADFEELLKTRCWLEGRALAESIAAGDAAWEEQVVLALHRLSRTPRTADEGAILADVHWEALHKAFHRTLISACGSSILLRFCDQLYDRNIRYRQLAGPRSYPGRHIGTEHEAIAEAALGHDAEKAVTHLTQHYEQTGRFLAAWFD